MLGAHAPTEASTATSSSKYGDCRTFVIPLPPDYPDHRGQVIYLSGYTRDSLLSQETFEEGTEFIEKPFTRDAILDRISRVLHT